GVIGYIIYWLVTKKGISPFTVSKGYAVTITEAPPDVAELDSLKVREPLITLLSPDDQARVAQRYGYDYKRESTIVASGILVFSAIGVWSSVHSRAIISLFVAGYLAAEQVMRLAAFPRGPAPSILRFLVRPLVRKFL